MGFSPTQIDVQDDSQILGSLSRSSDAFPDFVQGRCMEQRAGIGEGTVHGADELAEELASERCMELEPHDDFFRENRTEGENPS